MKHGDRSCNFIFFYVRAFGDSTNRAGAGESVSEREEEKKARVCVCVE